MSVRTHRMTRRLGVTVFALAALAAAAAVAPAASAKPGAVVWQREGVPKSGYTTSALNALSPNGDVFVVAPVTNGGFSTSFAVTCYKPRGGVRWQSSVPLFADQFGLGGVAADGKGGVVAAGWANSFGGPVSWVVCRWSAAGALKYQQSLNADGALAYDVVCDGAGNAYVAGTVGASRTAPPHSDWRLVKFDPTGAVVWTRSFAGAGGQTDVATAVARDPDGRIYVAGTTVGSSGRSEATVLKYTAGGKRLWKRAWAGPAGAQAVYVQALGASADGAAACGTAMDASSVDHPCALRLTSTGKLAWAKAYRYRTADTGNFSAVAIDKAGNVTVAGQQSVVDPADWDMLVARYKPGGALAWTRLRAYAESPEAVGAMALDAAGNIFVTGSSWYPPNGPERDCITWSLKPSGASRWFAVRRHAGFMAGDDIVVSAKAVYVSGGHGTGGWFLTKYAR